jgi:hypothetical protein
MFGDLNILRIFDMWNNNSEQRNKKIGVAGGVKPRHKNKNKNTKNTTK